MRWGTNEMGDQWDGEPMRWGTNEMGDQWCAPVSSAPTHHNVRHGKRVFVLKRPHWQVAQRLHLARNIWLNYESRRPESPAPQPTITLDMERGYLYWNGPTGRLHLARNIWLNYEGRRPEFTTRKPRGRYSVRFRIGMLLSARRLETLQGSKKGVETIHFAQFWWKIVEIRHFPHFC